MFNHKWPIIKILTYIHMLKFGLFEKHTKFEKIFFMVLTLTKLSADLSKPWGRFLNFFLCFSVSPNFNYNRSLSPEDFSSLDFVPYRYTAVQPAWEVYKLCMKHYWTHLCWHRSVCNHKSQLLTQVRPCNNR